jgi:hypothetical protein
MKQILIAAMVVVSAVALGGCSAAGSGAPETVATIEPSVPPVTSDDWDQSVTVDQFVEAFPEFDTAGLVAIPGITVQNNTRMWVLGSSDPDHSYEKAVGWAEDYVELEAEEGNDTVSGIYAGEKRNVSIAIRQVGDDEDTAAVFVYITSSI